MVGVTAHAKKRLKERCGVTKNSALKMAERAFTKGISFENASTELKKYISSVYLCHGKMCNNIRIYGNMVYIFDNRTLITVYPIPENIANRIENLAIAIDKAADEVFDKYTVRKKLTARNNLAYNLKMINLNDIKIPPHILYSHPSHETMERHRGFYRSTEQIKDPITIGSDKYLVNGYADYLIARENNYDSVDCICIDTPGNIRNRSNKRKELYEKQNGKCSLCDRQIPFELSSIK